MRTIESLRPCRSWAAVLATATLAACGFSGSHPAATASVRFSTTDTLFVREGQSIQLAPQAYDASGQPITATFNYSVEAGGTSVTVDGQGMLVAAGPGISVVNATAGVASAQQVVAVFGHPTAFNLRGVALGGRPYGITVGPGGDVFVTQLDSNSVTRISLPSLSIVRTIAVGVTPTGIASTPASGDVLVTNQFDPSIGIIDGSRNTQADTITAPATTFRVLLNPKGTRAYASASNGQLLVIDVASHSLLGTIGIPAATNALAWGPDTTKLYATSMTGLLTVLDMTSGLTVASTSTSKTLQGVAVAPDGSEAYIANETDGSVDIYTLPQLTHTLSIPLAAGAFGLALTPDGSRLYVTQPLAHRVTIIDCATRQVLANVDFPSTASLPRRVAFDRFGSTAVVSDQAGAVWALDANTGSVPTLASANRVATAVAPLANR